MAYNVLVSLLGTVALAAVAQAAPAPRAAACEIRGTVAASGAPLPGVAITATLAESDVAAGTSAPDGSFVLRLSGPGSYVVKATLAGFALGATPVELSPGECRATAALALVLQSRAPKPAVSADAVPAPAPAAPTSAPVLRGPRGQTGARSGGPERRAAGGGEDAAETPLEMLDAAQPLLPPGFSSEAPTESVALSGSGGQVQTADGFFRDRQQWLEEAGGDVEALARRIAQAGLDGTFAGRGPGGPAGPGGLGGGLGGLGPGGGPGAAGFRDGFGGFNRSNRVQGSVYYNAAGSPFDARPFSLNGQPTAKADYFQNRYGLTLGGPVKIPHVYDGSARTSFALNYAGSHTRSPYDAYSTVPTDEERAGDLSATGRAIYDPRTGLPFADATIPLGRIDPAARALLSYLPLPNQPGLVQNFHYVTATTSSSDQISLRLTHALGSGADRNQRGRGGRAGGTGGRGVGGGGFAFGPRRASITAALNYRHTSAQATTSFPTLGGRSSSSSWDVPVSLQAATGKVFHQFRVDFNRTRSLGRNLFANVRDVAGGAGIAGASADPFDWGVPNLSFTRFASLRDRNPSFRLDQRLALSDVATRSFGKHNVRFGGGLRAQWLDSQTDTNARGSFVFTGLYTSGFQDGVAIPGSGSDFADFLLGLAQQASVQYGPGRVRFRGSSWNLFLQDDWRARSNLTLNLGLRFEYIAPFREKNGHLVNLDVAPGFTAAAPVTAGQAGPWSGPLPASLVRSDWNNLAPRLGAAWKPNAKLTVRGGFGISYTTNAYGAIAQKLAGQPPFAVTNTLVGSRGAALPLASALLASAGGTTNSFGIDPDYQLPAVATWNADVQRQLGRDLVIGLGYTGTRGYLLDLLRAPNRGPAGLRLPGVAPFVWESSGAHSILHSGTLRVRRRMSHGFGGGFTYTYGKSIDDAAQVGGGAAVVAQDDLDLAAERGLSSFDRRHSLSADWTLELPIGPGRKWLHEGGLASVIGGWVFSGNAAIQSGTPFTARVLGDFRDVARGVNGTLRANVTGRDARPSDRTIQRWFDTAAFAVPAPGTFGDAGRNTIIGPGSFLVNMSLAKNVSLGRPRTLQVRVQANNVFNTPQLVAIDSVVNSPTFGQVVQAGPMRSVQLQMRFRF
jgi:hypothetical protein